MREIRQQLFLARNHVAQFEHARLRFGIINPVDEPLFLPATSISDCCLTTSVTMQRGEKIIPPAPVIFQRREQFVLALPELVEADFLDLRDAERLRRFRGIPCSRS